MPIYTIFDTILQMTVTASLCIPVILLIRLFLKRRRESFPMHYGVSCCSVCSAQFPLKVY